MSVAATQQICEPIQFEAGQSSRAIAGMAPPDDVVCYEMATAAGQRATFHVISDSMISFSIHDVVDGQSSYAFTTEARTYKIVVFQLFRALAAAPFLLKVDVESAHVPSDTAR